MISPKQLTVPWSSTSSFTYDGSPHSRALSSAKLTGVNSETVNLTTSGTGINASDYTYTTTASISSVTGGRAKTSNYSLTNSEGKFRINRAGASISFSVNNGTVGTSATYSYSYIGDGTVICSSASDTIATCSIDRPNKTITIKYKSTGTTDITLAAGGGTNYYQTLSKKTITVNGVYRTATVYANGNTLSTPSGCSASGSNRVCSCTSSGTSTSCNVTLPTISNSTTPTVCGYTTSSSGATSCGTSSGATVTLSSSPNYYAQTYKASKTYTSNFTKGTGAGTIGATSLSCTVATTYNGVAQDSSCNITLPTITPANGYEGVYWHEKNSTSGNIYDPGREIAAGVDFVAYGKTKVRPNITLSKNPAQTIVNYTHYINSSGSASESPYVGVTFEVTSDQPLSIADSSKKATLIIGSMNVDQATISLVSGSTTKAQFSYTLYGFSGSNTTSFRSSTGEIYVKIPAGVFKSSSNGLTNKEITFDTGANKDEH